MIIQAVPSIPELSFLEHCHFNKVMSNKENGELTFINHVLYARHCPLCLCEVGVSISDKTEGWRGQLTCPGSHSL